MSERDYGLGRLPAADPRDRRFTMRSLLLTPPVKTYRHYRTGPVLDQGSTSSCVGHAWRGWLSSAPLMTRDGPGPFDIYRAAQLVDEWPGEDYDGTSVRAGAKMLEAEGRIASYLWAWDAATVRDFLLSDRGTVVLGTAWYESMFGKTLPDGRTIIEPGGRVRIEGEVAGGHAYLCTGYSMNGGFRCQNSWGVRWGQAGKFWLSFAQLERLLDEVGEACTAIEQWPEAPR